MAADLNTPRRIRNAIMTRQCKVTAGCVVVLLSALKLVSCDYKPPPKTFKDYAVRGEFLTRAGRLDEAIENYRKALEIDPESAVVYLRLGQALRLQGKLDQAIENYRKALSRDPKLFYAYFEWGERSNPKVSSMKPSKNIKRSPRWLRNSIWHTSFGPTHSRNKAN